MNFSTDNIVKKNDVRYIPAGILENIKLVGVRIDKTQTGSYFLELTFQDPQGFQLKQTEFEPTKFSNMTEDEFNQAIKEKVSRLMDYLNLYYKAGSLKNESNSWYDFITWVASLLDAAEKDTPLRIKAVYNNRNYVTLPAYANYTFIERMDVKQSNIVKLGRDKFERPVIADTESKSIKVNGTNNAIFMNGNVTVDTRNENKENELPF